MTPQDGTQPKRLLSWTGERCVPWADETSMVHEHLHRYLFSAQFVDGKEVLDLGSGEGYGTNILASRAARAIGIELDELAVEHSRNRYPAPNLSFVPGSVLDLGTMEDSSFDVAVCFEVIEHLAGHDRLLAEVARVLRPDGLFIVSTPDREIYNEELGHVNPYHLKELDRQEFAELLRSRFPNVAMWGQRSVFGSELTALDPRPDAEPRQAVSVARHDDSWTVATYPAPKYLLAIASRSPLPAAPAESMMTDLTAGAGTSSSLRERHPLLGEAVMVGRSAVHALRRRAALALRERNRRRAG